MSLPKIAMVAKHSCIRVLKESIALKALGYHVELITEQLSFGYDQYDETKVYARPENLESAVRSSTADIFHVHNEPDELIGLTKKNAGHKPVIYDIHDMQHLRTLRDSVVVTPPEQEAFNCADAYIHVGDGCKALAEVVHPVVLTKPNRVIRPFVNEKFMAREEDISKYPCLDSLVYEGGVDCEDNVTKVGNSGRISFNVRNFLPITNQFRLNGFQVFLFSATTPSNFSYEEQGCCLIKPMIYPVMLIGIRPFAMGLCGAVLSTPFLELSMPNKLFEYMSQGVVPVTINSRDASEFVKKYDCGITLDLSKGLEDLKEQLTPDIILAKRKNLLEHRLEFTMERQIKELTSLYEEVL